MQHDIKFAYEVMRKLSFQLPESALKKAIDDGDYNINKLVDAEGYQELVLATERLMLSAKEQGVDLAQVGGFADVKTYYKPGSPDKVEPAEAMAYLVACAYAMGTEYKDDKLVSKPTPIVNPELLSPEHRVLAIELARQVLGDTFPKHFNYDTTTDHSLKPVINATRAVQNKQAELIAAKRAAEERANTWVE